MATLINICGLGRSGTTLLDLMLGSSEYAFSCGEVYAWFRPWRTHHFRIVCSCGEQPCPIWKQLEDLRAPHFHAGVCQRLRVDTVVDSSKEESWLIDNQRWAAEAGLDVYNLLLWRDPLDVAHSYWKRGHGVELFRRQFQQYYERLFSVDLPFCAIHFNELAANPVGKLRRLCHYVGLPFDERLTRFWEAPHHHVFGSIETRRQAEASAGHIRAREEYRPEFQAIAEDLEKEFADDTAMQRILRRLEAAELDREPLPGPHRFTRPFPMPCWYYRQRAVWAVRRYFPQNWEHEQ